MWRGFALGGLLTLVLAGCAGSLRTPPGLTALSDATWQGWLVQHLPGKRPTEYQLTHFEGRHAVLATADRSVSLLRKDQRMAPEQLGALQFSWKVPQLIEGADLAQRDKADSPVRLVLAFEGDRRQFSLKNTMLSELSHALTGEPMPYATLMYVWSNQQPLETVLSDPNTDRIRKVVVASGPEQLNRWLGFERDVRHDFERAFGEAPGALLSIALMTDADNTQSRARAYYGPVTWRKP